MLIRVSNFTTYDGTTINNEEIKKEKVLKLTQLCDF